MNSYEEKAVSLFKQGYNCAQAVAGAFAPDMGMSEKDAVKMASAFGGGMGRMREVCGAVSGMFMVLGVLRGYDDPRDNGAKKVLYSRVQELAARFREDNNSIICRELLGIRPENSPVPTPRTEQFYTKRPCTALVADAARILSEFLSENPE